MNRQPAVDSLRQKRHLVQWSRIDQAGPGLHLPEHQNDIGWDLEAAEDIKVFPGQYMDVPTNVRLALPPFIWAQILARSSTVKRGLMVDAGIIDPGYRGPLFAIVRNMIRQDTMDSSIHIRKGERIAQLVFHQVCPVWTDEVVRVNEQTDRGSGGFGSTGR